MYPFFFDQSLTNPVRALGRFGSNILLSSCSSKTILLKSSVYSLPMFLSQSTRLSWIELWNVDISNIFVRGDRYGTPDQLYEMCDTSRSSIQRILSAKLYMRRVAVKFVSRFLLAEQEERRLPVCFGLENQVLKDPAPFFKVITSGDFGVIQPSNIIPKKASQAKLNIKTMRFWRNSFPRIKLLSKNCTWKFWRD